MPRLGRRELEKRAFLEQLYEQFHRPEYLAGDPLVMAHRYDRPEDQEVAALISAAFAFGTIKAILGLLETLMGQLGPRPAEWLKERRPGDLRGALAGLYYRTAREEDIEVFLALLGEALRRHGSLGMLWRAVDHPSETTAMPALARFTGAIQELPVAPLVARRRQMQRAGGKVSGLASIHTILLASPARGSACKRMNLFLRWVSRPADGIDLGLWTDFLSPARLVMPIDTHVFRICRHLGLTKRKSPDLRTAEEITARLKRLNPEDPTRYDFALVRAGIEDVLAFKRRNR